MTMTFEIQQDDLSCQQMRELLALHLQGMRANSPAEYVCGLDISRLQTPEITVWGAWSGDKLASVGALRMLGQDAAEVKSMRTHPDFLGMGAGSAMLDHIISESRKRHVRRLSLETGSGPAFEVAIALYRSRGFIKGEPFADYAETPFNQYFHLAL